jgi:hypothetical protein
MNSIKNAFLILVILASGAASFYIVNRKPCDSVLTYRMGTLDAGFGIDTTYFLEAVREAEAIWEKSAGKEMFRYEQDGEMPISLIYDERQSATDQGHSLESEIGSAKRSASSVKAELDSVKSAYDKALSAYEASVAQFKTRQKALSDQIDYWNERGGAPSAEYRKLTQEQEALGRMADSIEGDRLAVNAVAKRADGLVDAYNTIVRDINSDVDEINRLSDEEFEQGEYSSDTDGQRIDIYQFDGRERLIRVLAHEFGHSLGIAHNEDPSSIMYYVNEGKGLSLSSADIADLNVACGIR